MCGHNMFETGFIVALVILAIVVNPVSGEADSATTIGASVGSIIAVGTLIGGIALCKKCNFFCFSPGHADESTQAGGNQNRVQKAQHYYNDDVVINYGENGGGTKMEQHFHQCDVRINVSNPNQIAAYGLEFPQNRQAIMN